MPNVVVNIIGDASKLKAALGQSDALLGGFEDKLKGFGDRAVDLGRKMSLAVTVPIAAFAAAGFRELAESGKVAAQTEAVIKSTGGAANVTARQVDNLSASLLKLSGTDDEAIASGQNLLLTFTNIRNEAGRGNNIFKQATKASLDLSVAFGKDMTDASILVGKALQDPIAGVTALRRVGVQLSDAQKDQIKTFVESGDIMNAQKVILGELRTEVGGSAEAYGKTMAGQVAIAKQELANASATMVTVAAPAVKFLADRVKDFSGFLQNMSPAWRTATVGVLGFAAALGPALVFIGSVSLGTSKLAAGAHVLAAAWETMALKGLYAVDAIKAMSTAQLAAYGGAGLLIASTAAIAIALSDNNEKMREAVQAGRRWAEVMIAGARQSTDSIGYLNRALADTVSRTKERLAAGDLDLRQAANLGTRIKTLSAEIDNQKQAHKEAEAAAKAQRTALDQLAAGTADMTSATDEAISAVQDFQSALLAAAGGPLGLQQSLLNVEQAEQAFAEALRAHGPASQEAREADLNLQQARLSVASATLSLADANDELSRKFEDPAAARAEVAKLQGIIAKYGDTTGAIQALIDKINTIPTTHATTVTADTSQAEDAIERLRQGLGPINLRLPVSASSSGVPHLASGGYVTQTGLAMVHKGEEWLGVGPDRRSPGGSGGPSSVTIPIYLGGRQVAEVVASELSRAGGPQISQRAIA